MSLTVVINGCRTSGENTVQTGILIFHHICHKMALVYLLYTQKLTYIHIDALLKEKDKVKNCHSIKCIINHCVLTSQSASRIFSCSKGTYFANVSSSKCWENPLLASDGLLSPQVEHSIIVEVLEPLKRWFGMISSPFIHAVGA